MPVHEAVEHVGDIPWEWLHADAPGYAPVDPSVLLREHRFRFRYLPDEPIWEPLIERYGNEAVWQFANEGARDLLVDASFHRKVYLSVSKRVHELTGSYPLRSNSITTSGEPLKYSDWYFASIQEDTESYPNPDHVSFRQSFAMSGMTLNFRLGVAATTGTQGAFGEQTGYLRYSPNKDILYQSTREGVLTSYGLPKETPILLTSKGVQTIKLVYESLSQYYTSPYRNATITPVIIGQQYKEAMRAINSFNFRYQFDTISDCPIDEIVAASSREGSNAIVVFIDPLENAPEMRRHDIGSLVEELSKRAKQLNKSIFFVCDNTLMAGQADVKGLTGKIEPGSPTVIISIESMLKYFSLGMDLSYLGSVVLTGDQELIQNYMHILTDTYRSWALSPGLYDMGVYPPVNAEYMHHRARRITRNSKILIQTILEERPDIEITWPGNNLEAHALCDKENDGFYGGMFFIKMQSEEAVHRCIKAIDEGIPDGRFGSIGKRDGFGYQQTTVAPFGEYVRVSVGNEDMFLAFCQATYLINSLNAFV